MGNCISAANTRTVAHGSHNGAGNAAPQGNFYSDAASLVARKGAAAIQSKMRNANLQFTRDAPSPQYNQESEQTIPGLIRMFSGCKDTQTSADVSDVSSFGIPAPDPKEKAGGACTNSLLHTLNNSGAGGKITFGNLLTQMQHTLKQRGYQQIPQLSSSRNSKLQEDEFSVWNPHNKTGRTRALLIGINYFNTQSQLNGCINDVHMMKNYLSAQGYSTKPDDMRILTDDNKNQAMPTGAEIVKGLKWLCEGAKAGDSLFLHYSGHGTQVKDTNGDEKDGMDEALVPSDYEKNGLITDDTLFQLLAGGLPHDAHLVCVLDCCHSGTLMDLPYIFSATNEATDALEHGENLQMQVNPSFNMEFAQQLLSMIARGILNQVLQGQAGGAGAGAKAGAGAGASTSLQSAMFGVAQSFLKGGGQQTQS